MTPVFAAPPPTDRRKRPRLEAPYKNMAPKAVTATLYEPDYRRLYEITMERGTSMAEAMRQIIRATPTQEEVET